MKRSLSNLKRLADRDPDVLDRVVEVDLDVTLRAHGQIEQAVLGEALEHVVEEGDPGRDLVLAGAVEIELDRDVGLLRLAREGRLAACLGGSCAHDRARASVIGSTPPPRGRLL